MEDWKRKEGRLEKERRKTGKGKRKTRKGKRKNQKGKMEKKIRKEGGKKVGKRLKKE